MEVDDRWMAAVAELRREYPYGVAEPRGDNFGIALLSRHPCPRCAVVHFGPDRLPAVVGELVMPPRGAPMAPGAPGPFRFIFVGVHPLPPMGNEGARSHEQQLREVGDYMARIRGPRILMGDLNTTPWSARFRTLARRSGLRDRGVGRGVARTWPVDDALLGIAINHFLSAGGVRVVARERGPHMGSDHFPLRVEFTTPPEAVAIRGAGPQ